MNSPQTNRTIGVTLLGYGTVGKGVERILREQADLLRDRTGSRFELRHVVVRDPLKHAADAETRLPFTTDPATAIDDPGVHVVIELFGGISPALELIQRALRHGKHVVTANKSLLAAKAMDLFAVARHHGACIAFEASCGGGIPIIRALQDGLLANRIDALVGIVNGTCNVILTRMTRQGWTYAEALTEAQQLGFAETDPTLDVSGRDAAQKLAILAGLAFDVRVDERAVHCEGIDRLEPIDIRFAAELGYVIKLLAIAERTQWDRLALRVHPTLVHQHDVLADVSGSFNAISIYGHALGHALFYGRGAGGMPTASAVVADLLSIANGSAPALFRSLRIFSDQPPPATTQPIDELRSRYYLRVLARDVPGTIAQIAAALGRHGISISAMLQREDNGGKFVPIVITTHAAVEGALSAALREIDALDCVQPPSVRLRIIDLPKEYAAG
jgi:homoserine dehydrogenase